MNRLKDRVAIVTGGGSGLGRATALLFAREGAKVVVADVNANHATETASAISDEGGSAVALETDVARAKDTDELARTTVDRYGRIDILVNNAGIRGMGGVLELSEEEWDLILNVNLKGMFLCSKSVLPLMKQQGDGKIICVSSISGVVGHAGQAAYNASKHGIIGLARCMAIDHAADGIKVNVVCPGLMNTPMLANESAANMKIYQEANLLKRAADPLEVAYTILHLASDESAFTTGAVVMVDGGSSAT